MVMRTVLALDRDVLLLLLCPHQLFSPLRPQPDVLARADAMARGNSLQEQRTWRKKQGSMRLELRLPEPGEALSGMEEQG